MFAIGRVPNVHGLGLENAGIKYDKNVGIEVNDNMLTANPNIYALGDCIAGPKFTHNSDVQARSVVKNALFFDNVDKKTIHVPYCTYTDPEVAHVGMNEKMLKEANIEFYLYEKSFEHADRALCDGVVGVYKIFCEKGTDKILGATLVGGPAGDMIANITQAMHNGIGL